MSADRDTHFTNFAQLLIDELRAETGITVVPNAAFDYVEPIIRRIIAQRAYAFACHAVNFTGERNLKMVRAGLWSTQQCVDQIPDMVEFPEEGL
jgi:hypothetical protein